MTRRLLVLTLVGSLGSSSLAFAGESLLQSGARIAAETARAPIPRAAARREALQEPTGLAKSGMQKRTKIMIYVAAGVGFALAAYAIDRHVVNLTPSSLGTRKD